MTSEAAIANDRFGLGARPGGTVPRDARGWLESQLRAFEPRPRILSRLRPADDVIRAFRNSRMELREMRQANVENGADATRMVRREFAQLDRGNFADAVAARLHIATASDTPFAERLVHFWSNHFAVSADRLQIMSVAADYEFGAIRPNLFGNFADLLLSAIGHPAMLLFLNQAGSIGPNSPLARRANARRNRQLGLNENLAREIMELHTLGVRSGYSQDDVLELAKALTGWTVRGLERGGLYREVDGGLGEAYFERRLHEPGARTVMGRRYAEDGAEQAIAIVRDLARHPATARHIATKLARHFISDEPPAAAVARLERAFIEGEGDLPALYRALIAEPEVWAAERAKFRAPWDWMVAAMRSMDGEVIPDNSVAIHRSLQMLGQAVWHPGSPAGWSDVAADWASPGALLSRVEVANRLVRRVPARLDPRAAAPQVLGDVLRSSTATAIARAEGAEMGFALLVASPEFMRR